jgi:hypothetical protein
MESQQLQQMPLNENLTAEQRLELASSMLDHTITKLDAFQKKFELNFLKKEEV